MAKGLELELEFEATFLNWERSFYEICASSHLDVYNDLSCIA